MKSTTAIHSLLFALIASASSFALAQGLGVGLNARTGVVAGGVPLSAGVQQSAAVQLDTQGAAGAARTDANANASGRVSTASGLRGSTSNATENLNATAVSATETAGTTVISAKSRAAANIKKRSHKSATAESDNQAELNASVKAAAQGM